MNIKLVIGLAAVTVVLASGCSSKPKKPAPGSEQAGSMGTDSNGHSHGGKFHSHANVPGHKHDGNSTGQGGSSSGSGGSGNVQGGGLAGSGSVGQGNNYGQGSGQNGGSAGYGGGNTQGQGGQSQGGNFDPTGYGGTTKSSYTPADLRDSRSILANRIIYFPYNQSGIDARFRPVLDAHASLLRDFPQLNVRLEGHADERGSREYNVALSERRAASVLDYMKIKGAQQSQADVVGYGEEIPAVFGHGEGNWSKNRRVEIIYAGE